MEQTPAEDTRTEKPSKPEKIDTPEKTDTPKKKTEATEALDDFFSPVTPPVTPAPGRAATSAPITEDEKALTEMVDEMDAIPALTYEDRIKVQGITLEEARVIVDALMTEGVYQKKYSVTRKHTVVFKTRDMGDQGKFTQDLEADRPMYAATSNALLTRHNLAASLVSFGTNDAGTNFPGYEKALEFALKLPEQVFRILVEKLRKFDILVMTVMDEGALENF